MVVGFKGLLSRIPNPLTGKSAFASQKGALQTVKQSDELFVKTNATIDGDECEHDCDTCEVKFPAKFKIEENVPLYGHVKAWDRHVLIATGKTDWQHTISGEKGSIASAIDANNHTINHGETKLSASNIPIPRDTTTPEHNEVVTRILVLPAFLYIDNVTPSNTPEMITTILNTTSTNTQPIATHLPLHRPLSSPTNTASPALRITSCPHDYLVLLCSHKTRDARCGQSAPLIKKELERHLRPLGLVRDLDDERPGGVGIYFISHVGGHKFSANVFVYRRAGMLGATAAAAVASADVDVNATVNVNVKSAEGNGAVNGHAGGVDNGLDKLKTANGTADEVGVPVVEAAQCIWLARVRPEDCENLVRYTILQGKVVKPESQLRGGFDRCKQLASW